MSNVGAEFWVFVSGKGGVGKSVLAFNAAVALSQMNKRVLLLDADLGLGNLHILANVQPKGRLERILAHADPLELAITPLDCGPDLLAADNGQTVCLCTSSDAADQLSETLGQLSQRYEYILVDAPRGLSAATIQFCAACDRTLLVTTGEPTSLLNAYAWYKTATLEQPALPVWLLANRTSDGELFTQFENLGVGFLGHAPHRCALVPEDEAMAEAVVTQQPLAQCAPDSGAWHAITRLVRDLQEFGSNGVSGTSQNDVSISRSPKKGP